MAVRRGKRIEKIVGRFRRDMQRLVDKDGGIDAISMQAGDGPPVEIARRKKGGGSHKGAKSQRK